MIVSAFAALISSGGAPRASIFMGQGDIDAAERTLGSCLSLQIIISAILTAVLLIFNEKFLLAFGASDKTVFYSVEYMNVYAVGTIFVQLTLGMNAFITAQGFTKVSMLTVLIGALLNIGLDPLFIFTFNMGVRGAASPPLSRRGCPAYGYCFSSAVKRPFYALEKKICVFTPKSWFPACCWA